LTHATPPQHAADAVVKAFAAIPALLEQAPRLISRGGTLDCECLLGPVDHPFHASIRSGRIVDLVHPHAHEVGEGFSVGMHEAIVTGGRKEMR